MQWVAYIELLGLYAAVHRGESPAFAYRPPSNCPPSSRPPSNRPLVVLDADRAVDGCPRAFAHGLRPGMPRRQVLRQVPGAECAAFGSADYGPAVRRFYDACAGQTPWVEPVTGHRLFLALPAPGPEPPLAELRALLAVVAPPGRLLARAALAPNKLLARAAVETLAPGARPAVIRPGEEGAFLAPLPLRALWPARPELLQRVAQLGLTRVGDLTRVAETEWRRRFGPEGHALAHWARGSDPDPVRAAWPPRAVRCRLHFPEAVPAAQLPAVLPRAAAALARQLAAGGEVCQAVSLWLQTLDPAGALPPGDDSQPPGGDTGPSGGDSCPPGTHAHAVLPRRTQSAAVLEQALLALLRRLLPRWPAGSPCSALTASASSLAPAVRRQLDLWGDEVRRAAERDERLSLALAAVQARFPARTTRIGVPAASLSRREAMLGLYDPMRGGGGAPA